MLAFAKWTWSCPSGKCKISILLRPIPGLRCVKTICIHRFFPPRGENLNSTFKCRGLSLQVGSPLSVRCLQGIALAVFHTFLRLIFTTTFLRRYLLAPIYRGRNCGSEIWADGNWVQKIITSLHLASLSLLIYSEDTVPFLTTLLKLLIECCTCKASLYGHPWQIHLLYSVSQRPFFLIAVMLRQHNM